MPAHDVKKGTMKLLFPEFQPMRVKYKDIFNLKAFYEALREWLVEHDWKDLEEGFDHWETFYGERISQGGGREIWMQWRPTKEAEDLKIQYYLDIDWHCLGISSTEIVHNGKKIKTNKGEVELNIRAFIERKYESEWADHWFLKHFIKLFTNRIYNKDLELREKELYQDVYAMQNFIKQWFKMKRYLPYEETKSFFPSEAYPSHMKE
ncbi:hypothetical protein HON71_04845 [Candidatus Woesearchaeota archaeon]|jgi:hypothetical protein|nr:hypothetical protein [Candidatus Woesearchaeota archaeon]MBT4805473.1 hypothetical protein [Candidatus Woesearchaeota archaeon]MBT5342474.1 hypothetical protein [Candidatus Woesearchaeota archaeon]